MIWYDYAVIKLSHLFELTKMELVQRFDATLRLLVNTGTVNKDQLKLLIFYELTLANKSFLNNCRLLVHYLGDTTNGVPTGCT